MPDFFNFEKDFFIYLKKKHLPQNSTLTITLSC